MIVSKRNNMLAKFLLYGAVIACMLFSGGLNWQYYIISNTLLFFAIILNKREVKFNYDAILLVIIMIFGMVSICFSLGDKQYAIHEYGKVTCLILSYYAGTAFKESDIQKIIGFSGALLAIFGLFGYCNLIRIDEFVFNDRKLLRLQSFIRYANTTALILGCAYFAIIKLFKETKKKYLLYLNGCVLTALFLTVSKAAIPIFVVISTGLVIVDKKIAKELIWQTIICLMTAIGTLLLVKSHYNSLGILVAALGIILSAEINIKTLRSEQIIGLWIALCFFGTIAVIVMAYYTKINIFETLFKRFEYMRDALNLLKKHWLIGIGSGGWKYYQYSVQSIQYNVTYVHNGWLQFWLENGIVSFAALIIIIANSVLSMLKHNNYIVLAALLLIIAHSFIDIDMSFGIVLIFLGLIVGNYAGACPKKFFWSMPGVASILMCVLLSVYMGGEFWVRNKFEKNYVAKNYAKSLEYAYKLEKICPYDSNLKVSIAALNENTAKQNIERAIALSPLDNDIYKTYVNYLLDNRFAVNITELTKKYINLAPKQEKTYTDVQAMLEKALKEKLCSQSEYEAAISQAERRRKKENVINRNELINELKN